MATPRKASSALSPDLLLGTLRAEALARQPSAQEQRLQRIRTPVREAPAAPAAPTPASRVTITREPTRRRRAALGPRQIFQALGRAAQIVGLAGTQPGLAQRVIERGIAAQEKALVTEQLQQVAQVKNLARIDPEQARGALSSILESTEIADSSVLEAITNVQREISGRAFLKSAITNLPSGSAKAAFFKGVLKDREFDAEKLPQLLQLSQAIPDVSEFSMPGVGRVRFDPTTGEGRIIVPAPFEPRTEIGRIISDLKVFRARRLSEDSPAVRALKAQLQRVNLGGGQLSATQQIQLERELFAAEFGEDSPQVKLIDEQLRLKSAGDLTDTGQLRREFVGLGKDFRAIRNSFRQIRVVATSAPSAAGDLALIFSFMKMLDPTSVVREGEQATAQEAAGVPERIRNVWNRLLRGDRLTADQRKDFLNRSRQLFNEQLRTHEELEGQYRQLARGIGTEPSLVVVDFVGSLREREPRARPGEIQEILDRFNRGIREFQSGKPDFVIGERR